MVNFKPPHSRRVPRFSQPRTFMRLPHVHSTEGVDVAVVGVPTDDAVTFRSGARFGPEAIRSASALLRGYNPVQDVDIFAHLSVVDWGDAATIPGYTPESLERTASDLEGLVREGVTTLCLGGDHTILLAELRAVAAVHGPLALVQLDSHHDYWEDYLGKKIFHGSIVKRAVEEGLVDPHRSVQAGLRGSLVEAAEASLPSDAGIDALTYEELAALSAVDFGDRVRQRVGDGPAFLSFDIDFVDPAFAPGTGTPEVGGPSSRQALGYVRALSGVDFRGFDCVEVAPAYDPSGVTALVAATACFEMLSLLAMARQGRT
jgi:agmatinase